MRRNQNNALFIGFVAALASAALPSSPLNAADLFVSGTFSYPETSVKTFDSSGHAFGPDGNLYVGVWDVPGSILKFDGTTGALLSTFVPSGSGGLSRPDGIEFGPDGNLYVSSGDTNNVLRFSGADGSFLDVFATIDYLCGQGNLAPIAPHAPAESNRL